MKQFFAINKVDQESRMVFGYASTADIDSQGEIVTKEAVQGAWDEYIKFGNIREMHQPSAVGVIKEHSFDDTGVMIGAHIVDDQAWAKVVAGVYKGFSIGGKKVPGGYDAVSKTITAMKLSEISLVDRPANPSALITMWKADDVEEEVTQPPTDAEPVAPEAEVEKAEVVPEAEAPQPVTALDQLVKMLEDGQVDADKLLELVKKDLEPAKPEYMVEVRKAFQALKAGSDEIEKGLHTVGELAQMIQSMKWLYMSCQGEMEQERDTSAVPARIASAIETLCDILLEMAREEVNELVTEVVGSRAGSSVVFLDKMFDAESLQKSLDIAYIQKVGARNSASDKERVQKAHNLLMEMGAVCVAPETEKVEKFDVVSESDKLRKAAEVGRITKLSTEYEKVTGELGSLRKMVEELSDANASLMKKFDDAPTSPKSILKVVGKDVDSDMEGEDKIAPVLKNDGSVDEVATQIKKVHMKSGRRF